MTDLITKVKNPKKIVTDKQVLKELERQGIDKDYVEFHEDYCAKHPFEKIYKDKKSNKFLLTTSGVKKCRDDGIKIEVGWNDLGDGVFESKPNSFDMSANGTSVSLIMADDGDEVKKDDYVNWSPQLFIDGEEVFPINNQATLLKIDPENPDLSDNNIEWDYGVCKRRIRIVHGIFREKWVFDEKPNGIVRVKHNRSGNIDLGLGIGYNSNNHPIRLLNITVEDNDVEVFDPNGQDDVYPIYIGATLTVYPSTSGDSTLQNYTASTPTAFLTIRAGNGNYQDGGGTSSSQTGYYTYDPLWNLINRSGVAFVTSALTSSATISAAVLSVYGNSKADPYSDGTGIAVVGFTSSPSSWDQSDYQKFATTQLSNEISYASYNTSGWNDFTLTSGGRALISKTGTSYFGFREDNFDRAGSTPSSGGTQGTNFGYRCRETGSNYPKLVITYTLPAPTPPTNVSATDGSHTDKVTITWTKSVSTGVTNYEVFRDGSGLGTIGDVATYDDTGADAPTITGGTASASDGTSADHVTLSLAGESANNGTTHTYTVKAYSAAGGWSSASSSDTGYIGVGSLGYQWYRSAADSDASYSSIAGGTTDPYDDTGAPADGSGRYYKCYLTATGATPQYSSVDRGYRDTTSVDLTVNPLITATITDVIPAVLSCEVGITASWTETYAAVLSCEPLIVAGYPFGAVLLVEAKISAVTSDNKQTATSTGNLPTYTTGRFGLDDETLVLRGR